MRNFSVETRNRAAAINLLVAFQAVGITCLGWFVYDMVLNERNLSTIVGMESDWIIFERLGCETCSTPACSV
jgi:hypothetical protein